MIVRDAFIGCSFSSCTIPNLTIALIHSLPLLLYAYGNLFYKHFHSAIKISINSFFLNMSFCEEGTEKVSHIWSLLNRMGELESKLFHQFNGYREWIGDHWGRIDRWLLHVKINFPQNFNSPSLSLLYVYIIFNNSLKSCLFCMCIMSKAKNFLMIEFN